MDILLLSILSKNLDLDQYPDDHIFDDNILH